MSNFSEKTVNLLIISLLFLAGCNSKETIEIPNNVLVIGDTIVWDEVYNSSGYEIYSDNLLVEKTNSTHYVVGEISSDKSYGIKAIASDGYLDSELSSVVTVQKNNFFSSSEIFEISLESDNVYNINDSIKKVVIRMAGNISIANRTYISILARDKDLIIELNDVNMVAPDHKAAIALFNEKFSNLESPFSLTIISNGSNKIIGGNSINVPLQPREDTHTAGLTGDAGKSAITMNKVAFKGNGNLEIVGGNGAPGGKGSNSTMFSSTVYGNGGKGGDGANGLTSNRYVVNLAEQSSITAKGGCGGKGGAPGENGSIITGPLNTDRWKDSYGADGYNGLALCGFQYRINGLIIID